MDASTYDAEERALAFESFDENRAIELGLALVRLASEAGHPVVIDIRSLDRTLFHAALPGSGGINDNWARRKSNTALAFRKASLVVGLQNKAKGESLAVHGLDTSDYADHGGAVPIRVKGTGVVAVATVSGLPQVEDHNLVIRALRLIHSQG